MSALIRSARSTRGAWAAPASSGRISAGSRAMSRPGVPAGPCRPAPQAESRRSFRLLADGSTLCHTRLAHSEPQASRRGARPGAGGRPPAWVRPARPARDRQFQAGPVSTSRSKCRCAAIALAKRLGERVEFAVAVARRRQRNHAGLVAEPIVGNLDPVQRRVAQQSDGTCRNRHSTTVAGLTGSWQSPGWAPASRLRSRAPILFVPTG